MKTSLKYTLFFTLLFLYGCSNLKYLEEGEALYVGGKVKVEDSLLSRKERKNLEKELEPLLRPLPNKKFLGLRPNFISITLPASLKKTKVLGIGSAIR